MIGRENSRFGRLVWALRVVGLALLLCLAAPVVAVAEPSTHPFEIEPASFTFATSLPQAGAHGDWTTTFDFAHTKEGRTFNDLKDTVVELPAGFVGSNTAVPTCTVAQLLEPSASPYRSQYGSGANCPADTQVGTITLNLGITLFHTTERWTFPVYSIEPTSPGIAAELGFRAVLLTQILVVTVRPGDSGLTITAPDVAGIAEPHAVSITTWGVPSAHVHDAQRGRECYEEVGGNTSCYNVGGEEANIPARPFLANPTSCGPLTASMRADSWEGAGEWSEASYEVAPATGCERVHFDPAIKAVPTTDSAESSSGLNVSLEVPQTWEIPSTLATANLKGTRVVLPEGYTVNPSAGNGLVGCTPAEYEAETAFSTVSEGCPPESKLGKVNIETPVLAERITGNAYLATPYDNRPEFGTPAHPGGSLLAMYIVAKVPHLGIIIKAAGKVEPDPVTGQLVATFDNTPQQPFNRFTLELKQGQTSPLVSPPACGDYTVQGELTPWSAPAEPRLLSNSLQIEKGVGGGPCPGGGVPPFNPTVLSGTQSNASAAYSPFYLRIARNDGEQELTRFTTVLPPGLTGNLSGIPFCSDAQIQASREATGQQELHEPSCPAASEIGHTLVGAGVGSVLAWAPGKVYLAGPYHGSALSIVSVTSAAVGPFDLGTVVIRFALRINPSTAQAEIDSTGSDPIPHIIDGIVVHVRDIHVYVDRPRFILNPTSCDPMSISDTVTGAGADFTNPADQVPVTVSTPFQAADCQNLQFAPKFSVTTTGKTSKANGASLSVKLAYPNAPQGTQANIHQVKVELPKQLPSRLTTLQKACTKAQFDTNPAGCPAASIVGHARAITPILPVPIEGPAYFVSNGGEAFPNLILVLQGYGVTIDLVGDTFISKQGITSSTFKTVPDEPVTSFELTLPQGPFSALAANGNLCALTRTVLVKKKIAIRTEGHKHTITRRVKQTLPASLSMPTEFVAQNGTTLHQNTPVSVTGCPKAKKAKTAKSKGKTRGRGKKK